jgi:hypothetical protein
VHQHLLLLLRSNIICNPSLRSNSIFYFYCGATSSAIPH